MRPRLRVMSANLRRGRADPAHLAGLVREHEIDALGLQELGPPQAEVVAEALPYGRLMPAADASGIGLALRRPARVELVPMAFRPLLSARLVPGDWPGLRADVELASAHVAAPHVRPYGSGPGHRRRQVRDLEGWLAQRRTSSRVLVGDFNATPAWPLYRRIAAHGADAARTLAGLGGGRPAPTWGPTDAGRRWLRLDHAFVSGLEVTGFEVLPLPGSDHHAIVVDLQIG